MPAWMLKSIGKTWWFKPALQKIDQNIFLSFVFRKSKVWFSLNNQIFIYMQKNQGLIRRCVDYFISTPINRSWFCLASRMRSAGLETWRRQHSSSSSPAWGRAKPLFHHVTQTTSPHPNRLPRRADNRTQKAIWSSFICINQMPLPPSPAVAHLPPMPCSRRWVEFNADSISPPAFEQALISVASDVYGGSRSNLFSQC